MTANYSNTNNFIVIADDDRDPEVSWQNHINRGSAGGVDCVAAVGTPVYAPADCTISNIPDNGSGGNTVTMSFGDGWRDQFMHLSQFVAPGHVSKGGLVGYSGDSGSPGAPHVHWHRIDPNGQRQNPWHYFTTPSGGGETPLTDGEIEMYVGTPDANVGLVLKGYTYGWSADGIVRPIGTVESSILMAPAGPYGFGITPVTITGDKLNTIARNNGIYEVTWNGLEPIKTGRIIGGPSGFDSTGNPVAAFPKVAGGTVAGGATKAEVQAISDASDAKVIAAVPKTFKAA